MSAPVWRRRRAGMRLRRIVRDQRRLLQAVEHGGHAFSPQLRAMLGGWRQSLEEFDSSRPRRGRR